MSPRDVSINLFIMQPTKKKMKELTLDKRDCLEKGDCILIYFTLDVVPYVFGVNLKFGETIETRLLFQQESNSRE